MSTVLEQLRSLCDLYTEEVVVELAPRICGLAFLVKVAPLLSWTELVAETLLLNVTRPCAP